MERFLSPLRASLPDIDVDVESARREEIYPARSSTATAGSAASASR